jgi:D-2-hydroxyacid dehydrogenase (NADP+)
MTRPLRILCSEPGRMAIEGKTVRLIGQRGIEWVNSSHIDLHSGGCDMAFVSRDVTGRSTKQEVLPETQQFYDALLDSRDLQWVHVHSAGTDRTVYQQLLARGVRVSGSVGANASVVAQSALTGLLMLSRRLPLLVQSQRERQWQPLHGDLMPRDLQGQRITIVGWGAIGQQLAAYSQMLGLQVTVARFSGAVISDGIAAVKYTELHQVLPHTDWLVLACPSTSQTHQLVDAPALATLPAGAHLINVARGDVVDEQALISALQTNKFAGAYLDVFAHEPLARDSALWSLPNVIVTPHCAGFSDGNEARVAALFLENLSRYLAGTL